jgi:tetratricopeptide (TPR) repeat protein
MLYHAGIIYRDLGDTRRAEDALRSALAINPQFHPLYSKVAAQTLQGLREQRETIARGQHE